MSDASSRSPGQIEVQEFLQTKILRKRLLPRAVLVGLVSGSIAVSFRIGLSWCESLRQLLVHPFSQFPILTFGIVAFIAILGTYFAMMLGRLEPLASGSGIPQMKAVLEGHLKVKWLRILWVKFIGALCALGSGLALGREGPTVQMGGAVGEGVGRLTKSNSREIRALSAAGAGAGLAAAFNAPLAGVTFVLEELQRDFQPIVFVASLLCAVVATVISRLVSGQFPVFDVPHIQSPSIYALPLFAAVGIVGGIAGVLFNKVLLWVQNAMAKIKESHPFLVATGVGLSIACAAQLSTGLMGGGHQLSESAIRGEIPLLLALAFFMVRFLLIHICYGTGVPGGIFAPLLSLGALAGLVAYQIAAALGMSGQVSIAACAVAGMCAMFSAVVRAPLTGVILIGEMTGSYDLLLPLLITSFAAYTVAEFMKSEPIYESLLQRLAANQNFELPESERVFVEAEIRHGSDLIEKKLKESPLPDGILVVLCSYRGKEFVPNGNTILLESMKISVLAQSLDSLQTLQELTNGWEGAEA